MIATSAKEWTIIFVTALLVAGIGLELWRGKGSNCINMAGFASIVMVQFSPFYGLLVIIPLLLALRGVIYFLRRVTHRPPPEDIRLTRAARVCIAVIAWAPAAVFLWKYGNENVLSALSFALAIVVMDIITPLTKFFTVKKDQSTAV